LEELHFARTKQFKEKESRMADAAKVEKDEFFRIIVE